MSLSASTLAERTSPSSIASSPTSSPAPSVASAIARPSECSRVTRTSPLADDVAGVALVALVEDARALRERARDRDLRDPLELGVSRGRRAGGRERAAPSSSLQPPLSSRHDYPRFGEPRRWTRAVGSGPETAKLARIRTILGRRIRDPEMQRRRPASTILAAAGVGQRRRAAAGTAVGEAIAGVGGQAALVLAFPSNIDPAQAAADAAEAAGSVPLAGMTGSGAIAAGGAIENGCSALAFAAGTPVGLGIARCGRPQPAPRGPARDRGRPARCRRRRRADRAALRRHPLRRSDGGGRRRLRRRRAPECRSSVAAPAATSRRRSSARRATATPSSPSRSAARPGPASAWRTAAAPAAPPRSRRGPSGRFLHELDGRPATEVYLERLGYAGVELGREEFGALAVTHPLAQPELNGSSRLRHVLGRAPERRARALDPHPGQRRDRLHAPIAAGDRQLGGPRGPQRDGAARRAAAGGADLRLRRPQARGRRLARARGRLGSAAPSAASRRRWPGLFSHGEIFRLRGAKGDRNHAIVVAAFA